VIKIRIKELIEKLKTLRPNDIVYVQDYETNSLKELQEVETSNGQIYLVV